MPHTGRTDALIRELLAKIDSADVYSARKEQRIEESKSHLAHCSGMERYEQYYNIADLYHNYLVDSSLVYLDSAASIAARMDFPLKVLRAELSRANLLALSGYYTEAKEILDSIPRGSLDRALLPRYFNAWANLYHNLYIGQSGPVDFKKKYRAQYNVYRDSLLQVADTLSEVYLHNIERKEARAGNFEEAKRYNAIRMSRIDDHKSQAYATVLYDRFAIAYLYERNLSGEQVDDLLESAIIEVETSNKDIASLLRVETLLINYNNVMAAKKVSDYYYTLLNNYGSRKRIIDSVAQTMRVNDRTLSRLSRSYRMTIMALAAILLLGSALVFMLFSIIKSRRNIQRLNEDLKQSGKISRRYVGVIFQLYSSYIKRLDMFRTKIHSSLRKGYVDQALELTSPLGDFAADERRELFHNFDTAFMDIFPDFIQAVNECMKPECRLIPKRTEILNTELRILALIKLGIEDTTRIAEMLHCSVKTVYNLRSGIKGRLAVSEDEFKKVLSEL